MGLIDQILSALVLLVCLALLGRLAIGPQRRAAVDQWMRARWRRLVRRESRQPARAATPRAATTRPATGARGQVIAMAPPRRHRAAHQDISQSAAREADAAIERARRRAAGLGDDGNTPGDGGKVVRHPRNLH